MLEIRHSFHVNASSDAIASALTEPEQIQNWWTREARVEEGRLIASWSGYGWEVTLEPKYDRAGRTVTWRCLKSNMQNTTAWEGTTVTFRLTPEAEGTRVDFLQSGYRESPCYEVCVQGWEFFVGTSLKQYVETGKGVPYPEILDTRGT